LFKKFTIAIHVIYIGENKTPSLAVVRGQWVLSCCICIGNKWLFLCGLVNSMHIRLMLLRHLSYHLLTHMLCSPCIFLAAYFSCVLW